jgi:hypothetical protein
MRPSIFPGALHEKERRRAARAGEFANSLAKIRQKIFAKADFAVLRAAQKIAPARSARVMAL